MILGEVLYAWSTVHGLASLWLDGTLSYDPVYKGWGIDEMTEIILNRAGLRMGSPT